MRPLKKTLLTGLLAAAVVVPVVGQVHKYFTPGSVWLFAPPYCPL